MYSVNSVVNPMRASPDLRERLVAGAAELGVPLEAGQVDALLAYLRLLGL